MVMIFNKLLFGSSAVRLACLYMYVLIVARYIVTYV